MSCQQKPFSLNEDWFAPALPLGSGTALLAQEDFLNPDFQACVSVLSADLL